MAHFFGLPDARGAWPNVACELVRGVPPTRLEQLTPEEQEKLARACEPGMRQLGRAPR
jgi:hypothetical protein